MINAGTPRMKRGTGPSYCRLALVQFAVAVFFAAALVSTASAQETPERLVVLGAADHVVMLVDAERSDGKIGRLTLLVRNESDRSVLLRVRFYPDGGDLPIRLRALTDSPFPTDVPALYTSRIKLAAGRLSVPRRHTTVVPLRFGVGEDAKASVVNGTLVFAAQADPRVQSAFARVTGQLPPAAEQKSPSAQPPKVALRVQRWFPGGIHDRLRLVEEPLVWVPGGKSEALVLLASTSGHSMKAQLVESDENPPVPAGMVEQRLTVKDLNAVGTYAGTLTLEPGGTNTVAVEAKVRDVILWPLIVAGLGAALGGYAVTRGQRWRTRQLLRSELARARSMYGEHSPDSPIGSPGGPTSPAAIAGLETSIASAKSEDELDELTGSVRQVRDAIALWLTIDSGARRLAALLNEGFAHGVDAVERDTHDVLDATAWIPDDAKTAAAIVTQLRRQEAILRAFEDAYRLWPGLATRVYEREHHKEAWQDDGKTAQLIGELGRIEEEPDLIVVVVGEGGGREEAETVQTELALTAALDDIQRFPGIGSLAEPVATTNVHLTSEQLERPVRRWDLATALVTFLATVLVFVLGIYSDSFGTWEDYAKALTAGFVGQIGGAALWNLFPALRSYRLPVAKPAK